MRATGPFFFVLKTMKEISYADTAQRIQELKQELRNDVISYDEYDELNDELESLTELRVHNIEG